MAEPEKTVTVFLVDGDSITLDVTDVEESLVNEMLSLVRATDGVIYGPLARGKSSAAIPTRSVLYCTAKGFAKDD